MDEFFSCRNCIHNSGQTLALGNGAGFCIHHDSLIHEPIVTTCKYLHRKDLPWFTIEEAKREHASEFAEFSGMANLHKRMPINKIFYSEKFAWENGSFDPIINSLARYHKSSPSWIFVESFSGGLDGRRSIAHSCLVRRYMSNSNSWKSSYRLVLAVVQELSDQPHFKDSDLYVPSNYEAQKDEALWELIFIRLTVLQEYGWHSGLEYLQWITDALGDDIVNLDWNKLESTLSHLKPKITEKIINHAREEGEFFPNGEDMLERQA